MPLSIRTAGAIALVAGIAVLDAVVSPRLPFSILYFIPVMASAWVAGRTHGLVVAAAAIAARVATDVRWSGVDQLAVLQLVMWGASLVMAAAIAAWAHSRRGDVSTLEQRISELLQIERSSAHTDPLTSLCNRRAFVDALQKAEARGRRNGERLAVARLDIDGFKTLNDAYSRTEGDQLLRAVATSLSLTTRMGDVAARLENDEFALLLYNCSPDHAQKIGRRVVDEVAELGRVYPRARVTASIGMACFIASGPDPDEMMRLAGHALRHARHSGGNSVVVETAESAGAVSSVSEPPAS